MSIPKNQIIQGNCLDVLQEFPTNSIDLIFADPPYNLQLSQDLWRPDSSLVDPVDDAWDQFESFEAYDDFSTAWLSSCRRILKETGSIWVIGSYHNIFRVGKIMQNLGFWFLNDVIWIKTNPMPNFKGVRFTNAHETLIWAVKSRGNRYTFNHHAMKRFNHGKQMRSDWIIPICSGKERIKINGEKAHATQKPEALLYRVILSSTNPGDLVLDPFFGTGTTGAVAKVLHRDWVGIEADSGYVQIAQERINSTKVMPFDEKIFDVRDKKRLAPRVAFSQLLEAGLLLPGQKLYFRMQETISATIKPDGYLVLDDTEGSIHQVARHILGGKPCNGWDLWYYQDDAGEFTSIDNLRTIIRNGLEI